MRRMPTYIDRIATLFRRGLMNPSTSAGLLLLGLCLEMMYLAHAGLKLFEFTLPSTGE